MSPEPKPNTIDYDTFRGLFDEMDNPYARSPGVIKEITLLLSDKAAFAASVKEDSFAPFLNNAVEMVRDFVQGKKSDYKKSNKTFDECIQATVCHIINDNYDVKNNGVVKEFIKAVLKIDADEFPKLRGVQENAVGLFADMPQYNEHKDKILSDVVKNKLFDYETHSTSVRRKAVFILGRISRYDNVLQLENARTYDSINFNVKNRIEKEFKKAAYSELVMPFFDDIANKKLDDNNAVLNLLASKFDDKELGKWAVNKAVEWSFKNEPNSPTERQYVVDKMIAVSRKVGKNHPVNAAIKEIAKIEPNFVEDALKGKLSGYYGFTIGIHKDEFQTKLAEYYLENKRDALSLYDRFIIGGKNNSLKPAIAAFHEGVAEVSGPRRPSKGNVSLDNKAVLPPIL